jgi:hypothetical protein
MPGYQSSSCRPSQESFSGGCNNRKIIQPSKFFFTHAFWGMKSLKWYFFILNKLITSVLYKNICVRVWK